MVEANGQTNKVQNMTVIATIDDKYRVVRSLGKGGFATTYLALDEEDNQVAIKVMNDFSQRSQMLTEDEFKKGA